MGMSKRAMALLDIPIRCTTEELRPKEFGYPAANHEFVIASSAVKHEAPT
jgi:hypothetical protein